MLFDLLALVVLLLHVRLFAMLFLFFFLFHLFLSRLRNNP